MPELLPKKSVEEMVAKLNENVTIMLNEKAPSNQIIVICGVEAYRLFTGKTGNYISGGVNEKAE